MSRRVTTFFERFIDRRAAGRDGRSGSPEYVDQPEPTPYVNGLIAELFEQSAAEDEALIRDTAPWRQGLAKLTIDIQAVQDAPAIERQRLDSARQTTTNGVRHDPDVEAWRQRNNRQAKQQLEEAIASRHRQYLARQQQLVAHAQARIENYWGRLVQIHPNGEWLSEWTKEWTRDQLAGALEKLIEINELNRNNKSSEFGKPPEGN